MRLDNRVTYICLCLTVLSLMACGQSDSLRRPELSIESQINLLQGLPKEDTSDFKEKIEKYKIFYSLTTTPSRISLLNNVLDTLDFSVPKKVFIVIPAKYR